MSQCRRLLEAISIVLCAAIPLGAQQEGFFTDVLCFAAELPDSNARVDVWSVIPYATLTFRAAEGGAFQAQYQLSVTIRDSAGQLLRSHVWNRRPYAPTYSIAQGATAAFEALQSSDHLPAGSYTITVLLRDEFSGREYRTSRRYEVPDYQRPSLALSSILLASTVEEHEQRPRITPFFSDDVAQLGERFFAAVELISRSAVSDSLTLRAELLLSEGKQKRYELLRRTLRPSMPRTLLLLPLQLPADIASGSYRLRVLVEHAGLPLAQSERSLRIRWSAFGRTVEDLERAIRQLRYVATQAQIDSIASAPTAAERRRRFEEFWAALDPTPGTLRNEAFEEYYDRIAQADRLFRSYTEGWQTDRGMVYVIFGPPLRREQFTLNGRQYERWTYADREFLFVDYTGFQDYRLLTPLPPDAKYRYNR